MPRTALIVDDSRTALAALSRLLKAQGIGVDTVESGQEALNYLRHNAAPGVVFLDHMMPGMDGFETLAAIKGKPLLASIPVVMYTSKEGDAYMGQALVLGALGVLHKPVNPLELNNILQRIDRLRLASASVPPDAAAVVPARPLAAVTGVIEVPAELRAPAVSPVAAPPSEPPPAPVPPRPVSLGRYTGRALLLGALLLPAGWYYQRYQQADAARTELLAEVARLQAEQRAAAESGFTEPPAAVSEAPAARRELSRAWPEALAWAINQHSQYGPNEEPLGDARLAQLRELVERLVAAGFRGELRLETHVGEFCLARDEQGTLRVPADDVPFNRCEVQSQPPALAEQRGLRQSPAFARYLAEQGVATRGIRLAVVSHGAARPITPYPDPSGTQAAGEWNRSARLNQRVEVVLVPGS